MFRVCMLWGAVIVALSSVVSAQSLKIKQVQQTTETRLSEEASDINRVCGKEILVRVDWNSFGDADYEGNRSISGYCSHAITALREICRSSLGKETVQTKVAVLECARGAERRGEIREDGVYRYEFTWQDSDQTMWHINLLQNKL